MSQRLAAFNRRSVHRNLRPGLPTHNKPGKFRERVKKITKKQGISGLFLYFQKVLQHSEEATGSEVAVPPPDLPIRFPWQKSDRQAVIDKKFSFETNPENFKGRQLMRIKFPEHYYRTRVGPGYPTRGLVYANLPIARGTERREVLKLNEEGEPLAFKPLNTNIPQVIDDGGFEAYCKKIGIGVYKGEPAIEDESGLDLKAFDLYWEDIRIETNTLIREIRNLPLRSKVRLEQLDGFERPMYHMSRSCYFSPGYTHKEFEDVIHILVWLINRRNLPLLFHIKCLQCLSLIVYSSPFFKAELAKCGGVKILVRIMQLGMVYCGLMASWALYCLTMAAIGSVEVIQELRQCNDIDERVGEMTFHVFWYDWPTNFGLILQSILFGPGGVANQMDDFEFL